MFPVSDSVIGCSLHSVQVRPFTESRRNPVHSVLKLLRHTLLLTPRGQTLQELRPLWIIGLGSLLPVVIVNTVIYQILIKIKPLFKPIRVSCCLWI